MNALPKLITFDGEARSGKGTIVHAVRKHLRSQLGLKAMLIDAGQVFRSLVVAADQVGVDFDDEESIDAFLGNDFQTDIAVQVVKSVYHMPKDQRNQLLYNDAVGVNSAKVGARPLSQQFKDSLLRKWLTDARLEGYQVVLLDGRALEEVGTKLQGDRLCQFVLGFYFVCDPLVGARRTLNLARTPYEQLSPTVKASVDRFAADIRRRNQKDLERAVQPIRPPKPASVWRLPDDAPELPDHPHPILLVDTSREITKSVMVRPVADLVAKML